ncbi:MFS transporter [Chitinophaga sp. GCM10012297]|uniref:MFS transporter n=1 Tax=Chitinophaga chungangae TaxID=2821488 RepID=A0ABS3YJT5_9BACT|nr:MFS transporter [Chitinophaga chungangae]MBO9154941.1 MFS transporter [Chitinophaga chungangae]
MSQIEIKDPAASGMQQVTEKVSKYRWRILAMLFVATTINYVDRSIIGVLGPTLQNHVFHWTNTEYSNINFSFMIAYALGMLLMGGLVDRLGTKFGYAISIGIWSVFSLAHALVTKSMGWIGFAVARFGLGIGESGNFPSCIKTVAEWFPKKERAFATGIFNAGTNIGAILAPLIVPLVVMNDGTNWQFAFCVTFVFSAVWLVIWLTTYKKPEVHPKVSKAELDYILSDTVVENNQRLPWKRVFGLKETWAFAIAKTTDAVWWFYLFWGGFFLHAQFGLELKGLALPMMTIYLISDIGSIVGGWLSSKFIKMGWTINKSRKTTLLLCAILIMPVAFATQTDNQWVAVLLIGLAAGGHQAWSANIFTIVSDVFPKKATASVVGIGGMVGALASAGANLSLGRVLDSSGKSGYFFAFLIAGCLYLVALLAIHLIMPKMRARDENLRYVETN